MTSTVLVAGIGNFFLGDDGFGPEVARRIAGSDDPLPAGVRVVDYGIRGMHLAYDLLEPCDALVIVDTVPGRGAPGELSVIAIGPDELHPGTLDAHGMDPAAVLGNLDRLGGRLPPTYLVGCQPASVADGIGLSPPVEAAVPGAVEAVRRLLADQGWLEEKTTPTDADSGS